MKLAAQTKLDKALTKLAALGGNVEKFVQGQVRENARLLISSSGKVPGLVQLTPPFHEGRNSSSAKEAGQNAILGDVNKVYADPGDVYGLLKAYGTDQQQREYWYLVRNKPELVDTWLARNGPSATQALKRGWDGGEAHKKRRKKGRVTGNKPSVSLRPGEKRQMLAYMKMRQKRVGMLASSIPAAYGGKYGPLRGVPAWVMRHRANWGEVREKKVTGGLKIRVTLAAPFAVADMQRRAKKVLNYRYGAMRRSLPYALRAEIEKLTR